MNLAFIHLPFTQASADWRFDGQVEHSFSGSPVTNWSTDQLRNDFRTLSISLAAGNWSVVRAAKTSYSHDLKMLKGPSGDSYWLVPSRDSRPWLELGWTHCALIWLVSEESRRCEGQIDVNRVTSPAQPLPPSNPNDDLTVSHCWANTWPLGGLIDMLLAAPRFQQSWNR